MQQPAPPATPPARRRRLRAKPHPKGRVRVEINVTPLVDVVLVLLIIFMVITPMIVRGVSVDLPVTSHHDRKNDDNKTSSSRSTRAATCTSTPTRCRSAS